MVNVTVTSAGTSGPRGSGWLSGAGVPASSTGFDGDFYLDTTNVGYYYGPKTSGAWGAPSPFGNSLNGVPLTNVTATAAPTVSDDNTQGYSRGSYWINTTTDIWYVATDVTTGAAVWNQLLPVTNTATAGRVQVANGATSTTWAITPGLYSGTGLISGAVMTQASSTSFSITAGKAVIVDYTTDPTNPTAAMVTINAQTITLNGTELARAENWWVADASGTITSQATRPQHAQRRTAVQLGVTQQVSNVVTDVTSSPIYTPQANTQFYDLLYELGPFNAPESTSNTVSANGANLSVNKAVGQLYVPASGYGAGPNEQHYVPNPAETPGAFYKILRNTTTLPSTVTLLNPTVYDSNGVLTAVGGGTGSSTIQRVFLVPTGIAGDQLVVQYGQTVYSSLTNAVNAIGVGTFVVNPLLDGVSTLLAWIVMTRVCTSLQDTANATIVKAQRFALP